MYDLSTSQNFAIQTWKHGTLSGPLAHIVIMRQETRPMDRTSYFANSASCETTCNQPCILLHLHIYLNCKVAKLVS